MTLQEIQGSHPKWKHGYVKIQQTCRQAIGDGFKHVWIDSCCINKESSAELSEAINSMYTWYGASAVCYVYLEDFEWSGISISPSFATAKWFTRGWTLQELLASHDIHFYDANWNHIGPKEALSSQIAKITKIDRELLVGRPGYSLRSYSVAARMAWAANRKTTRIEDRAYSLLGIFGINMPLLYGEGDRAFQRLQEEILRSTGDQSILAWNCARFDDTLCALLAPSPDDFQDMREVVRWDTGPLSSSQLTNLGLEIDLPVLQLHHEYYLVLNCHFKDNLTGPLALCVFRNEHPERPDQWEFWVQTHRNPDGRPDRIRLIPHDAYAAATRRRLVLSPRFSNHDHFSHYVPLTDHNLQGPESSRSASSPDLWVEIAESAILAISSTALPESDGRKRDSFTQLEDCLNIRCESEAPQPLAKQT